MLVWLLSQTDVLRCRRAHREEPVEIVGVVELVAGRVLGRLADAFGLIGARARQMHVARWVAELAIKVSNPENPVKTLSGGNQQRVVLAKWMATNLKKQC